MSLGFSVEVLLPHARVSGPLRMGLMRLAGEEWLAAEADLAMRAAAFDAHPDAVLIMPEAQAAETELAEMLGVDGGIEVAARAHHEDFCILTQDAPGSPFRLTGAAVGYPTDWQLTEKMGKALLAVHEPIDGYADQLAVGVDHFMERLRAPQISQHRLHVAAVRCAPRRAAGAALGRRRASSSAPPGGAYFPGIAAISAAKP